MALQGSAIRALALKPRLKDKAGPSSPVRVGVAEVVGRNLMKTLVLFWYSLRKPIENIGSLLVLIGKNLKRTSLSTNREPMFYISFYESWELR